MIVSFKILRMVRYKNLDYRNNGGSVNGQVESLVFPSLLIFCDTEEYMVLIIAIIGFYLANQRFDSFCLPSTMLNSSFFVKYLIHLTDDGGQLCKDEYTKVKNNLGWINRRKSTIPHKFGPLLRLCY